MIKKSTKKNLGLKNALDLKLLIILIFHCFSLVNAKNLLNNLPITKSKGFREIKINVADLIKIRGVVTSTSGDVLAGATVQVKGTKTAVLTNIEGSFTLDVESNSVLIVSYVGFEKLEVPINNLTKITIRLKPREGQLGEVVVTALGIKRQPRSLGYSTTQIPGAALTESRTPNLAAALTGQIAGVSVAGTGTGPNGSTRITIRGNSSLTAGGTPLYIIDGIPFENSNQGQSGQYGGTDNGDLLSTINPDDIESINVLKGAGASALYGYRGGNGVIIITTKSGATKKGIGIEINNNTIISSVIDYRDYQYVYGQGSNGKKADTLANFLNDEYYSWGAPIDGSSTVNVLGQTVPYIAQKNNFKNFYKTGVNSQTSLALLGGNENGNFRLGLSNSNSNEVVPSANSSQLGLNFNGNFNLSPQWHLAFIANYAYEKVNNRPSFSDAPGSLIASTNYLANTYDIRTLSKALNPDGSELLPGTDIYFDNPYFIADYFKNTSIRNRYTGKINLKYDITSWMSIQGEVNRNSYTNDLSNLTPYGTAWQSSGALAVSSNTNRELNTNFLLDINKPLGNHFKIHANLGANHQDNLVTGSSTSGSLNIPYFYSVNNIVNAGYVPLYAESKVNSVFGAADFSYKDYLFLELTGRNDWFSVLTPKLNHEFYPSISSSFVLSDAFKLPNWINFAKLRASFGQSSGNGNVPPYSQELTYAPNPLISYQGLPFFGTNSPGNDPTQGVIPNAVLQPLTITEEELGFNLSILESRLSIDVAGYNKLTTNDLVNVTASYSSGYASKIENVGKLRNRGIEILLSGYPLKSRNFSWKSSLNFATNSSKVLFLSPNTNNLIIGDNARYGTFSINQIVGLQYGQLVGYKYLRNAQGQKEFDDNGLPLRTSSVEPLGSGVYRVTGGFNNEFRYKNFLLSFLFDYKFGAKIYSVTNGLLYTDGLSKVTLQGRIGGYVGQGVKADGITPNTTAVPAQTYFTAIGNGDNSTDDIAEEFVYDASFIKLRNMTFGFSLPSALLTHSFIKGVTFSIVGRNLAILLKHIPNVDPESNLTSDTNQGIEYNTYPPIRNLGFNINLKF